MSLKSPVYTYILGNVKLDSACHYWRIHVDEFNAHNKLSIIGRQTLNFNVTEKRKPWEHLFIFSRPSYDTQVQANDRGCS